MAAAYLYHIVMNHPFLDGNKRVGLLATLVFLDLNGHSLLGASEELYQLTMRVADGSVGKDELAGKLLKLFEANK